MRENFGLEITYEIVKFWALCFRKALWGCTHRRIHLHTFTHIVRGGSKIVFVNFGCLSTQTKIHFKVFSTVLQVRNSESTALSEKEKRIQAEAAKRAEQSAPSFVFQHSLNAILFNLSKERPDTKQLL